MPAAPRTSWRLSSASSSCAAMSPACCGVPLASTASWPLIRSSRRWSSMSSAWSKPRLVDQGEGLIAVVRELLLGPKRYTDLRRGLPNASPNVLAERLRELERAGVLRRRTLPPPAGSRVYELTEWGMRLEDTVVALGLWGGPVAGGAPVRSADSVVLALRAQLDPGDMRACFELRVGDERFRIELADGAITAE